MGYAGILDDDVLQSFNSRIQQITPCEAIAVLVALWTCPTMFKGLDIIWFIDNQAAMASLIKGSSSHTDICLIATLVHLMLADLHCRVFFEYVETDANVSDGLSRDGILDTWTAKQHWILNESVIPPFSSFQTASLIEVLEIFRALER